LGEAKSMTSGITLNPRTRFVRSALFQPVDRPPYIETHGFWPQVVDRWHDEGLPAYVKHKCHRADFSPGDITIEEYFGMEDYAWPQFMPSANTTPFWPPFEREVLQEDDDYIIFRDTSGVIRKDVKRGRSMPQFLRFPVESRSDWEALKLRLDVTTNDRYEAARKSAAEGINDRQHLEMYCVCGTYGLSRNLFGEEKLAYVYYDDPTLMHEIMKHWLAFYVENARRITALIDCDWVYFWEDMAFKTGPLIGPNLFREFMLPYYRELTQEMRLMGLKVFCLDCDGNPKVLMDDFVDAGINSFMPCEIAADMEPEWISDRYRERCSIMGGIDKRPLAKGKAEIDAEVLRKVPRLLDRGGYIPGVDHATPSDVSFENYCYFVDLVRGLS
jgi:hypothetical protein